MAAINNDTDATRMTVQLQLEDLEVELGNQQEYRLRTHYDRELALLIYRQELRRQDLVLRDHETAQATGDQEARHDTGRNGYAHCGGQDITSDAEDVVIDRVPKEHVLLVGPEHYRSTGGPTTSQSQKIECEACFKMTDEHDILTLSCNHQYCKDCIIHIFESTVNEESSYPPHCCQEITVATVVGILSTELVEQFNNKATEYLATNRTYCSATHCSTFIPPGNIWDDVGTCPACQQQTCTTCKSGSHGGDCPFDVAHQALIETAREHGWRRCYSCSRMLELETGCNHMT